VDHVNKNDVLFLRIAFVVVLTVSAAILRPFLLPWPEAAGVGCAGGIVAVLLERRLRGAALKQLVGGTAGLLIGGILGLLFVFLLRQSSFSGPTTALYLQLVIPLSAGYIGLLVGMSKADLLNLNAIGILSGDNAALRTIKLLDTSVIIDGRIADIAESGFLEGVLAIPVFVLRELQLVADSSDSMKRNRGRRGLDVVQRLQKMSRLEVQLVDEDFPHVKEVDLKLIELAKIYKCKIMTNDFNLNKVAQVHGVGVMNINELANALKPIVLPGETMRVFILKEGKEYNQGVAYLDDGTMVVVDNAKRLISKTIDITVTSVLQTTAGKMIFGKYDERGERGSSHPGLERSSSPGSGSQLPANQAAAAKQ
jgi:uncharacterized protein YacL